jgi:Kef-type K+ transport system membrane component KefB
MNEAMELLPAVILLGVGLLGILAARLLKTSPIVTFIAAGLAIGPFGLGLIDENPTTVLLAQLGVVFLLFDIGLSFSLKTVRESRSDLVRLAPVQMLLCTLGFGLVLRLLGLEWPMAILLGAAAGISATAVVSATLSERSLATCPLGRSTTAVLVFQDVAGIFLLVFAASLEAGGDGLFADLGMSAGLAAVCLVAALLIGRFLIGPAFKLLSKTRNEEIFTAAALFIVLATAAATGAIGLSLTFGAFLAGMIIADTPFRPIIRTEAKPFGALLLGFFFITVGAALDWRMMLDQWAAILIALAALFILKTALSYLAALLSGWSLAGAAQLAFLIAQGSEFGLVILALPAVAAGLGELAGVLVAASALSLALTPLWAGLGLKIARAIARWKAARAEHAEPEPDGAVTGPVIVFGMTGAGRLAVDALDRFEVPVIAIDSDPDRFLNALADGYQVSFGDPSDTRLMATVGAVKARALALSAPRYEISLELTPYVRRTYPELARFVAVDTEHDRARHAALGMRPVMTRGRPEGIEFAVELLRWADMPEDRIADWVRDIAELDAERPAPASQVA